MYICLTSNRFAILNTGWLRTQFHFYGLHKKNYDLSGLRGSITRICEQILPQRFITHKHTPQSSIISYHVEVMNFIVSFSPPLNPKTCSHRLVHWVINICALGLFRFLWNFLPFDHFFSMKFFTQFTHFRRKKLLFSISAGSVSGGFVYECCHTKQ